MIYTKPKQKAVLLYVCAFISLATFTACSKWNSGSLPQGSDAKRGGLSARATNAEAFAQTLYPLLVTNCAGCHNNTAATPTAPFIADADANIALIETLSRVDLTQPANSRIATKVAIEAHSCWTPVCANDALTLQASIEQWASMVTDSGLITDPLAGLPEGQEQIGILCARLAAQNAQNVVRDAFCGAAPAQINGLTDLQASLGLAFTNPNATGRRNNGRQGNPAFALSGHSSSLVARFTNPINPRALIFTTPRGNQTPGFVAMGFLRGDQFAELVVSDRVTNDISFFLVTFKQACNLTNSCTPGDLLTPAVESNWIDYTVYGQADLANTIVDCLQCHQTGGPGTPSILRMQELANPWTHFFRDNRQGGQVLLNAFTAAHGTNEAYAGIPAQLISASDPALLEDLVRNNGFGNQPNRFNSRRIQNQVNQTPGQPATNAVPGTSTEWQRIYNATVTGQFIAVPYHDVLVTDPAKLASATAAYQSFLSGAITAADLPDIRNIFLESALPEIGFRVMAGLDGQQIITQACTQCHNSLLDQTITRARFNTDLAAMSDTQGGILTGAARDAEISVAIARLKMAAEDVRKMPPEFFKTLDAAEITSATSYLCSQMAVSDTQCSNVPAFVPNPATLPPAAAAPGAGGGFPGAGTGAAPGAGGGD